MSLHKVILIYFHRHVHTVAIRIYLSMLFTIFTPIKIFCCPRILTFKDIYLIHMSTLKLTYKLNYICSL